MSPKKFFEGTSLVTGATLGAGIFTLPYVFQKAGWATGILYLLLLGACVVFAHSLYWETLEKVDEKERLLGLAEKFLGRVGFFIGLAAIIAGILLSLVIYLMLGRNFVIALFPGIDPARALFMFWGMLTLLLFVRSRKLPVIASFGVLGVIAIIVFIALPGLSFPPRAVDPGQAWFPFGPVLFSLAGWTAVEPLYEARKRLDIKKGRHAIFLGAGTLLAAALYFLFVAGIFHSAPAVTEDTVSGLLGWPFWRQAMVALLGLFGLLMSGTTISFEVERALEYDLHVRRWLSRAAVVALPIGFVLAGVDNFVAVVGFAGGAFVSLQYLLILRVADRVLRFDGLKKFFAELISLFFILAGVYEIAHFILR